MKHFILICLLMASMMTQAQVQTNIYNWTSTLSAQIDENPWSFQDTSIIVIVKWSANPELFKQISIMYDDDGDCINRTPSKPFTRQQALNKCDREISISRDEKQFLQERYQELLKEYDQARDSEQYWTAMKQLFEQ